MTDPKGTQEVAKKADAPAKVAAPVAPVEPVEPAKDEKSVDTAKDDKSVEPVGTQKVSNLIWGETNGSDIQKDGKLDVLYTCYLPPGKGRLTVYDRMTGFDAVGRDIESGYRNEDNEFWLASGGFDVRTHPDLTIDEAIAWIKENANTSVGKEAE